MKYFPILLSVILLAFMPSSGRSHSGQVNALGCHTETATGEQHCHTPSPNMYQAKVTQVLDGDTIKVSANLWQDITITSTVRLRGIDAPEISGAKCDSERKKGILAKEALAELVEQGVILTNLEDGKFGRRIIADVLTLDRRNVAAMLMEEGMVRAYDGKGPRSGWCA